MRTDRDKRRAEKKNKIGANYWRESNLAAKMLTGADHYGTYGFLVGVRRAGLRRSMPIIRLRIRRLLLSSGTVGAGSRSSPGRGRRRRGRLPRSSPSWRARLFRVDDYGKAEPERELEVALIADDTHWRVVLTENEPWSRRTSTAWAAPRWRSLSVPAWSMSRTGSSIRSFGRGLPAPAWRLCSSTPRTRRSTPPSSCRTTRLISPSARMRSFRRTTLRGPQGFP
jgi:hypothetical protein